LKLRDAGWRHLMFANNSVWQGGKVIIKSLYKLKGYNWLTATFGD